VFGKGGHTETEGNAKDLTTNASKDEISRIINAVHLRMIPLEYTNHVIGPGSYSGDDDKADNSGDDAEDVEDCGDGQDSETDLGLHHESDGTDPTDLHVISMGYAGSGIGEGVQLGSWDLHR